MDLNWLSEVFLTFRTIDKDITSLLSKVVIGIFFIIVQRQNNLLNKWNDQLKINQ